MSICENYVKDCFMKGYDCSQVVVAHFAERLGISAEIANKVSACYGGGMMEKGPCGAYTGGLMVIGLKYGHWNEEGLMDQKGIMMQKSTEFKQKFYEKFSSNNCKELLGYDITIPEEFQKSIESGRMFSFCPCMVKTVVDILEEMI